MRNVDGEKCKYPRIFNFRKPQYIFIFFRTRKSDALECCLRKPFRFLTSCATLAVDCRPLRFFFFLKFVHSNDIPARVNERKNILVTRTSFSRHRSCTSLSKPPTRTLWTDQLRRKYNAVYSHIFQKRFVDEDSDIIKMHALPENHFSPSSCATFPRLKIKHLVWRKRSDDRYFQTITGRRGNRGVLGDLIGDLWTCAQGPTTTIRRRRRRLHCVKYNCTRRPCASHSLALCTYVVQHAQ